MHIPPFSGHYDLISPDGMIEELKRIDDLNAEATIGIEEINPHFAGFRIPTDLIHFNIKSTLAQLGLEGVGLEYHLEPKTYSAKVKVHLKAIGPLAKELLSVIVPGDYVGKLFAADDRRRVRDPEYLTRMFGRADRDGLPLLLLGGLQGGKDLVLEKVEGRAVAFLTLLPGSVVYDSTISGFLPTLTMALKKQDFSTRDYVQLHQHWDEEKTREIKENDILLVKTLPLHIRTVFGRVVQELLPPGVKHTTANILQPDTFASGDIYELFGHSEYEIQEIPLEFYTLEPFREYVFFSDRDQLQASLEDPQALFRAFDTAPAPRHHLCATFIAKGEQLLNLTPNDWISTNPKHNDFPGLTNPAVQSMLVEKYIEEQPSFPYMLAIEDGTITSQGILLLRHFPSPLMKRMLLGDKIQRCLKAIYFEFPSLSYGDYFSHEDRSLLLDLAKFAIPTYWVDRTSGKILQYIPKPDKDSGMFVPLDKTRTFSRSTSFGIYGSNLVQGVFEGLLYDLMKGLLEMRAEFDHPLFHKDVPIALITGGGPGAMEVGNRVAKNLDILSCANIVDFRGKADSVIHEQTQNPYIDAKMTYRLDRLVERQAEFNLDFPIFLQGGIGTDFEYNLEELRRKVGNNINPVLLLGENDYWKSKITTRFQCNLKSGTIRGSEWVSNCFYCVQTAEQGLNVYRQFFSGTLPIGKHGPIYEEGFVSQRQS